MNIEKLKQKIRANGFTIEKIAKDVGMDPSTFYRKLNADGEKFTLREMFALIEMLHLTKREAGEIFFGNKLA